MDLDIFKSTLLLIITLLILYYSSRLRRKGDRREKPKSGMSEFQAISLIIIGSSLFMFVVSYLLQVQSQSDIRELKEAFQQQKSLICSSADGLKGKGDFHLVSQAAGWSVYDHYFKKDHLLIEISSCSIKE
ncbi:MAG: hypothetical protein IE880_06490 [Epsilonproteobacteria bacterium]|nr:hypothetical protein [Campylobacterota bacterium]